MEKQTTKAMIIEPKGNRRNKQNREGAECAGLPGSEDPSNGSEAHCLAQQGLGEKSFSVYHHIPPVLFFPRHIGIRACMKCHGRTVWSKEAQDCLLLFYFVEMGLATHPRLALNA